MPTVLTPQGWVKVAAAPRKKKVTTYDPAEALKGPLAYFSCQPLPSGKKDSFSRPQFPYDLSASPEKLQRQAHAKTQAKIGGKNRTISAPQPGLYVDRDDDSDDDSDRKSHSTQSSSRSTSPPSKMNRSQRSSKPGHANRSGSPSPSHRSAPRHRPVEAVPPPVVVYHTSPASNPSAPRHSSSTGYQNYYYSTGGIERPPPPTNARSMSYSWYNATTPLNL
ncbi:hypothetical protein A1O1_03256 [Capronia coronata CBS 617.96]|uniref:Uncharacterized protein n=1 Tax=Capronia coronata CBS 617.96 TaxID=1182541 RepID=W9YQR5_9EURO|nr:uncharacterized protein A1O1_03256 [Capronia coronata CBS 617.96]EXJ94858.1 hypothetical protein A1O1_03256 [Capronia coronata CBS 617.96]